MSRVAALSLSALSLSGIALALSATGCSPQSVELFEACDACVPLDGDAGDAPPPLSDRDPARCGATETHCEDDEYCVAGECVCREGMSRLGEECVDPLADGARCGPGGVTCAAVCEGGACVAACAAGSALCEGGCVDLARHPLHCGECGRPCGASQLCVGGLCRAFVPVSACEACALTCCAYPTRPADTICVDAPSC